MAAGLMAVVLDFTVSVPLGSDALGESPVEDGPLKAGRPRDYRRARGPKSIALNALFEIVSRTAFGGRRLPETYSEVFS